MLTVLCLTHTHDTNHLFNCGQIPTQHNVTNLWKKHFLFDLLMTEVISKRGNLDWQSLEGSSDGSSKSLEEGSSDGSFKSLEEGATTKV